MDSSRRFCLEEAWSFVVQTNGDNRRFMMLDDNLETVLDTNISKAETEKEPAHHPKLVQYLKIGKIQELARVQALRVNNSCKRRKSCLPRFELSCVDRPWIQVGAVCSFVLQPIGMSEPMRNIYRATLLALAILILAATPLHSQQDAFHWVNFHTDSAASAGNADNDQNVVIWVTRALAGEKWTAIREIGVQYDAALVITTERTAPMLRLTRTPFRSGVSRSKITCSRRS